MTMPAAARRAIVWTGLTAAVLVPVLAAAASPLLAWRDPVYILAGFAGIAGLALLLIQPLLAGRLLPGPSPLQARRAHVRIGTALVAAVIVHVGALWITSPPDVVDGLLLASPTAFSVWGVVAMWAVFASAALVALRRRWRLRPATWRRLHTALAAVIVTGTVIHALLIQGTMEPWSKAVLCALAVIATATVIWRLRRN